MKISVVIPAFNAASNIENVLKRFPDQLSSSVESVWIINDGSTDTTTEVLMELAQKNRALKPQNYVLNSGYGMALKRGFRLCREEPVDIVAVVHSDGQYPPEAVAEFAQYMIDNSIDILQGSRLASGTALSGGMPVYKYIAGKVLTILENFVFKLKMSDYHSGFILYRKSVLQTLNFERLSNSFDFDLEMIASGRAMGLSIAELPIPTRYAQEKSYLNPITYGMRVLKVLCNYLVGHYRRLNGRIV